VNLRLRGIVIPAPTAFLQDGELDEEVTREVLEFYVERKVHGIFLLGSFGQGMAMRTDQRKRAAEIAIDQVKGRVPVVIQVGATEPYTAVELAEHAKKIGADAIGMVPPYYYSDHTEYEIFEHFRIVDRAVGMPILLYNNEKYCGINISPETMGRLVKEVPRIIGVKLAFTDLERAMRYIEMLPSDFAVFALPSTLIPGLLWGVKGTINPPMSAFPELGLELTQLVDEGRLTEALHLQKKILTLLKRLRRLAVTFGKSVHCETLRARGFRIKHFPRYASRSVGENEREEIRQALAEAGVPLDH